MHSIIFFLNYHRNALVALLALTFWIGAYWWYFRGPIQTWLHKGPPHNWSVDLVSKTSTSRGKLEA